MDCSLPGSSARGILQARVLEWGAIAFSERTLKTSFKYLCHLVLIPSLSKSFLGTYCVPGGVISTGATVVSKQKLCLQGANILMEDS